MEKKINVSNCQKILMLKIVKMRSFFNIRSLPAKIQKYKNMHDNINFIKNFIFYGKDTILTARVKLIKTIHVIMDFLIEIRNKYAG